MPSNGFLPDKELARIRRRPDPLTDRVFQPTPLAEIIDGIGRQKRQAPLQTRALERLNAAAPARPAGLLMLILNGEVLDENTILSTRELGNLRDNPGVPQLVNGRFMDASADGELAILPEPGEDPAVVAQITPAMLRGEAPLPDPAPAATPPAPLQENPAPARPPAAARAGTDTLREPIAVRPQSAGAELVMELQRMAAERTAANGPPIVPASLGPETMRPAAPVRRSMVAQTAERGTNSRSSIANANAQTELGSFRSIQAASPRAPSAFKRAPINAVQLRNERRVGHLPPTKTASIPGVTGLGLIPSFTVDLNRITPVAFGGEGARTADTGALKRAKALEDKGADADKIWRETGWFRGADGKWRFEISDEGFELNSEIGIIDSGALRIGFADELFRHPKLFAAYPELRFIRIVVEIGPQVERFGFSDSGMNLIFVRARNIREAEELAIHEIQHIIQSLENQARAGIPKEFEGPGITDNQAFEMYWRLAGEVEARNAMKRLRMTPEERRKRRPEKTEDIPRNSQILRF